jgi:hypothetical protein
MNIIFIFKKINNRMCFLYLFYIYLFYEDVFWMVIIGQGATGYGTPSRKQNKKGMEDLGKGLNLDEVWHFSSQD